mmetsp:Transcript_31456/g.82516  ORF Transcript_31456/g.82516 Transcript_31456/m.82516 type:complete len:220 (+) Transcript_31456:401-1060(+)
MPRWLQGGPYRPPRSPPSRVGQRSHRSQGNQPPCRRQPRPTTVQPDRGAPRRWCCPSRPPHPAVQWLGHGTSRTPHRRLGCDTARFGKVKSVASPGPSCRSTGPWWRRCTRRNRLPGWWPSSPSRSRRSARRTLWTGNAEWRDPLMRNMSSPCSTPRSHATISAAGGTPPVAPCSSTPVHRDRPDRIAWSTPLERSISERRSTPSLSRRSGWKSRTRPI